MYSFSISTVILMIHLVAIAWIDFRSHIIPNVLNFSLAVFGCAVSVLLLDKTLWVVVFDAGAAVVFMLAVSKAYHSVRGRIGVGVGDVKFLGAAATWVGLFGMPWIVLIAAISGLLFAAGTSIRGGDLKLDSRIAFGPHLSIGLMFTWALRDVVIGQT
jgi:leader peptidase (prepilin peptidase) / N-methyltransferase